jgi:hypothetical protein
MAVASQGLMWGSRVFEGDQILSPHIQDAVMSLESPAYKSIHVLDAKQEYWPKGHTIGEIAESQPGNAYQVPGTCRCIETS